MMFKLCYIITEVLLYFVTLDWITLGRIKRKRVNGRIRVP